MNQPNNRPLILAVDDEASNLQLLRQILQDTTACCLPRTAPARWNWRARSSPTWCCWT